MEQRPRAVSFDIWSTLVEPNPIPAKEGRKHVLAKAFGIEPTDELGSLLKEVSREFDHESEKTGVDFDCGDRIDVIADRLGKPRFTGDERAEVVSACQVTTRNHPPVLIHPETKSILEELRKRGVLLSAISNTGYAQAPVMREVLKELGIHDLFHSFAFSGEVGKAKPSQDIFTAAYAPLGVEPHEALHVGDSLAADYEGARASGAKALLFDPKKKHGDRPDSIASLDEVLNHIQ